ncbi:MAG: cytochrome c biogenesis protein CcdA [Candidatus Omnitrophica bacterium]|nr:cytochrome c biogenesis protein CcdA [Candidatus Omnitrophota bacterium]MCM8791425.1 cytochrome c biogenesis protein CcdA [Candidatus Omnitrophota bacterium]
MATENVSYLVAFTAGILTFLSPCILPLVPSFIAYITGVSFGDLKDGHKSEKIRFSILSHTILFILGFSIVFIILGLTATAIGQALFHYQRPIRIGGGALIVIFGLTLAGIIKIPFLQKEHQFHVHAKKASYVGSFLVGVTFAAAWTPCAGPILGSILVMAGTGESVAEGARLLTLYSAGIAIPFLFTALATHSFLGYFNRFKRVMAGVNVIAGIFLIIIGILIMTDYLNVLSEKMLSIFSK